MGAKKILFMDLLRIMTLEEINELTTKHGGEVNSTLTELLERELLGEVFSNLSEEGAQILPFKTEKDLAVLEIPAVPEKVDIENPSTTTFILQEKKRLEKNRRLLKAREIINLYLKEAAVNIEVQKKNTDDLKKSVDVGILINKKQF